MTDDYSSLVNFTSSSSHEATPPWMMPNLTSSGRCQWELDEEYLDYVHSFQYWCEGVLFTGVGLAGLIANCFSIGILCTKDMRKHSFNQLLIALCVFDLLFIIVSIPVYSFNLFQIFVENQVNTTMIRPTFYIPSTVISKYPYFPSPSKMKT